MSILIKLFADKLFHKHPILDDKDAVYNTQRSLIIDRATAIKVINELAQEGYIEKEEKKGFGFVVRKKFW